MKRRSLLISLLILLSFTFAGLASAHVTVQPQEVPANSYQVFTLRVPSEKDASTTQVKVEVPAGVEVSRFEPKPDWTYELAKNADGKIVSVTWKTAGKGLGSTEFGQFNFQGKVAEDAKELVWKAYQTYADSSVVEWIGAPDADKPASVTKVTGVVGEGHGAAAGTTTANDNNPKGTWTLVLSAVALVVALIALFMGIRKKA